ncbi:MAG TPA: hypothetical protein DDW24_04560 [Blastocatellia bacterium]|nr:hypothetical protein [Blastocatellia bacterium]
MSFPRLSCDCFLRRAIMKKTVTLLVSLLFTSSIILASAPTDRPDFNSAAAQHQNDNKKRRRGRSSDDSNANNNSNSNSSNANDSGSTLSRSDARRAALNAVPGTVVKEEYERKDGIAVYEFYIRKQSGETYEVYVDAGSGRVSKVERRDRN